MSNSYNYSEFCSQHINNVPAAIPVTGELAPGFSALTLQGEEVQFPDATKRYTVLEMGSMTCPIFHSRRNAMAKLITQFPDCDFVVLYVREAHPGERIPRHLSIEEKSQRAGELMTQLDEHRRILIDDIQGTGHQLYGAMPNSVFVIGQDQRILFQSDWNDVSAIQEVLMKLSKGEKTDVVKAYFKPANPFVFIDIMRRAGKGAMLGFVECWSLIIEHILKRNIREFLKK